MATAKYSGLTDASGNANITRKVTGTETALILGLTGYGVDFKAWGATSNDYLQWDNSASKLLIYRVTAETSPGRTVFISNKGSAMAAGQNLQGMQISSRATGTGTIAGGTDGAEIKAGMSSDSDTGTLAAARGVIANVDAKKGTITTGTCLEAQADIGAGGTFTTLYGVRASLNNSGTVTTGKAFCVDAVAGYPWGYGVYITARMATKGFWAGEDSDSVNSGIPLNGASWSTSQGNAFYSDDGGTAMTGYTETFTARHLITANQTGGVDASCCAIHPDLTINANYTGIGGLSAIWGNTTIKTGKTVDTSGGLGDVGGGTFGLDVVGTLASNAHGCAVSAGLGGSGTKNGIITAFRVRSSTGTVVWDGFASMPASTSQGVVQVAAAGSTQDAHLKIYLGTTLYTIPMYTA